MEPTLFSDSFFPCQVVGLTASLGVGDTDKISKAVEHILQICGNLDAEAVSTVQENREELEKYANTPERKVIMVSTRRRDIFLEIIGQVSSTLSIPSS